MNYQQLIEKLKMLPGDARQCTVTVLFAGEFMPIQGIRVQAGDDILDDGHPYLEGALHE